MHRCAHTNHAFESAGETGFRCDGKPQCWIADVGQFETSEAPNYYCVFHAPLNKEPLDRDDWSIEPRGTIQADQLRQLLDEWNKENEQRKTNGMIPFVFVLPDLHCGDIDLGGYTFSGDAAFVSATFSEYAGFRSANFSGEATFDSATFSGDAAFVSATFSGEATFDSATFSGIAWFDSATFSGEATFESATFSGDATFVSATFSGDATFESATFSGDATFVSATFSEYAGFRSATFSEYARFRSATFSEYARFDSATFSEYAGFRSATFSEYARFDSATFSGDAEFENTQFNSSTDFSGCVFINAPTFHNAQLHQGTDFRGTAFKDTTSRSAPPAYRTLKLAMGQVRSRKEEGDFYALEQKSLMRQADTRLSVKLFSLLYQIFSDYGRSFIRPLVGFLILTVVFLAIYYGALLGADDKLVEQYPSVIRFTFEQVFRPFNVWTKKGAEALVGLAGHKVLLVQFLATVHSLFSITLTTLFVLAIRRRFKLG